MPASFSSLARSKVAVVAVAALAVGLVDVVAAADALAAVSLNVTTTADIAANAGDCGTASTTVPSPLSLREATCIANNYGNTQAVTINVPAGTYTLSSGELQLGKVNGSNITLTGAGSASTVIDGNHASRVLDLDPSVVGGVTTSISGVTITNGRDGTFGGAGIIAGSGHSATTDTLTVSNSVISNNQANFASPSTSNKPGGGISFQGGTLSLTNDVFSGNQSFSSAGSAVWYQTFEPTGETLTVTGSTFSGNAIANSGASGTSGGALGLSAGAGGGTYTVSNSSFTGNTASSSGTGEAAAGGAIFEVTGNLTVTGSTFTSNSVAGSGAAGGPIIYAAGTAAMHYNRFVGNTGTGGVMTNSGSGSVDALENWWGCNTGPNTTGCETTSGTGITAVPRLVLTATASPSHVVHPSTASTITASLLTDSAAGAVSAANVDPAFAGLPVGFADPPGDATVGGSAGAHSVNVSGGAASIGYQAGTVLGPDNVLATLDNGTATAILEVDEAPAITSANTAHFTVGSAGSFTITTTGYPAAAISETGSLPSGLTFHDNGDGSATISGTPGAGTGGNYTLNLTAANGYLPNASQTLTVNVSQPPAFTSGATASFVIGSAGSFSVTTSGVPTVATITESGTLPTGITFTDNGNGTATIAGTPTGAGNTYPLTLTASNGVSPNATQSLTIQVNQAPSVTLNPTDQTTAPGNSVSFVAAASGVPTPTVQWQVSTDNGVSFSNVAGALSTTYTFTAVAGDNGNQYRAVFSNGVGSPAATTAATLNVGIAPAFTSADNTSFVVGQAGSFTITTTGLPSATLSRTGAQFPAWLTLTDNGDGTGALTGTPPADSAGTYQFTLKAANGFSPSASQLFTLFVDDSPVITSADHTSFTAGSAGSFAATTTAGFPTTTALTETGSLPAGVTFDDNGDGTATLAGTPAAGTGGTYPITITATAVGGLAAPATQSFTLTVLAPPIITSANHATFGEGSAGSFTVTTSAGNPTATTLTETGTLPGGVSFTDNGDGTATLAGTPNVGSHGVYTITITAGNGVSPAATQTFTLTVNAPPQITSADHATFTINAAAAFTVTTTGQPTAALSETGSLPPGTTFTDNGDGTATLGGTPTSGGSFTFTITASNGVLPDATQSFTATVNASPQITSADHTTFAVGAAGTFTVTTISGFPPATTITESGSLPTGVSFTDNGDGTATLAGTPAAGTAGSYPLTLRAGNSAGHTDQTFTLTVVRQSQTITVTSIPPSPASVGGSYPLSASSDSGLDVSYSIDAATTNAACSLSGSTVSFDAAGSCVVDFNQAGNDTFAPATQMQQVISVTKVGTAVSVTTSPTPSVYGQDVQATASVTADSGTPSGSVQFSVDGTDVGNPVVVSGGSAVSPVLTGPGGVALAAGSHTISAQFTPDDAITYASSTGSTPHVVNQAATTTTLSVHAHDLRAVVAAVPPGSGTPTGTVSFSLGGQPVGSAPLVSGVATLTYTVPVGRANMVAAAYSGDSNFTASSMSMTRRDPKITAQVSSAHPRTRSGWYRSPVTVTFTCFATTAPLTGPCPAPVVLDHGGAAQSVTRTISATDGGEATVVVSGISIDLISPHVSIGGVRDGATYDGAAPQAHCLGSDRLSGIASCRLTKSVRGTHVTYRAVATDRAGNVSRTSATITVLAYYLVGAPFENGAFTVHPGRVYTLVVTHSARRPVYYDATVYPLRPTERDNAFYRAGHNRWTLGILMQRSLRTHPYWNIGVRIGSTLHIIKIRIA